MELSVNNNIQIFSLIEKAWRSGGGAGASSGLGGKGRGKGPGSRGGKFFINQSGHVEYGTKPSGHAPAAKPKAVARTVGPKSSQHNAALVARIRASRGQSAVSTRGSGGGGKPRVGELRPSAKLKAPTAAGKLANKKKMLKEMDAAISSGKDPHGNKLSPTAHDQLRMLATGLRTELGGSRKKEIFDHAKSSFTIFKDKQGRSRWVGVSSSATRDADGETISQKALTDDVIRKDKSGNYGPLNWWHVRGDDPQIQKINIGWCDFNAMDGPLLVESGTFNNERAAQGVEKAISSGRFKPALSLEFKHNEPQRRNIPIPGLVFNSISREGRALLPAEEASNPLTRFVVYNKNIQSTNSKEVNMLTDKEKRDKALEYFGEDFLSALESDNETAVKAAVGMGMVFKAVTGAPDKKKEDDAADSPGAIAPVPVVEKADPVPLDPVISDMLGDPGPADPSEFEDSPADNEADAIMQGLYDQIAKLFIDNNTALAAKLADALSSVNATATKEANDLMSANTTAMKAVSTALSTMQDDFTVLKSRLDALENGQPAVVRNRISAQPNTQEVTDPKVLAALKQAGGDNVNPTDPFASFFDWNFKNMQRGPVATG